MLDYSREAMPLYLQIKNELKKAIEEKKYAFDTLIPGELELEKYYGVSRITVRQAILALEREGYVERARGKGTRVVYHLKTNSFPYEIKSFTQEMLDRGIEVTTKYAHIEEIAAGEIWAGWFSVLPSQKIYHLHRTRMLDGTLAVIFDSYLSGKYNFSLDVKRYYDSLYHLFSELNIKKPVRVVESFAAQLADEQTAKELECPVGSPILYKVRKSYDADGDLLEYSMAKFLGDQYEYIIELIN